MNIRKVIISFFAIFLLTLCGCLNYEQEISLYPDGSGSIRIHYWMTIPDSSKNPILDQIGLFNSDSLNSKFSSESTELKNVEVFVDSIDSTLHSKIEVFFSYLDSLNNIRALADHKFSLIDGAAGQKILSQFIPPTVTAFGLDGTQFTVKYSYDVPGEIIQHNSPNINKQTLTWEYTLSEIGKGKTISITYRPFKLKETPIWIYVVTGLVLLVVFFFLLRKKRTW